MLGTHLNIETFFNALDCSKFSDSKKALIDAQIKKCKRLQGENRYNIEYKQARETLLKLYMEYYTLCEDEDEDKVSILKTLKDNIKETDRINKEKKEKLDSMKAIIDKQNKNLVSIDEDIEKQKHYDAVKQHRIIGSENLRKRSFIEYYIYIVLIIVFVLIQIILLVF